MPKPKEGFDSTPWNLNFEGPSIGRLAGKVRIDVDDDIIGEVDVLIGGTNSFEHYHLKRNGNYRLPNGNFKRIF